MVTNTRSIKTKDKKRGRKMKKGLILSLASLGVVATLQPIHTNATDSGDSQASVTIQATTGELKFTDITTNAHIVFEDTWITGAQQTANEKVVGASKVKISDTRSGIAPGKTGAYSVTIKDSTPTTEALSFINNNLRLNIKSSDNGKGTHNHTNVVVGASEQEVFSGVYEAGVTEHEVVLNPTLDIPSTLTDAGDYFAQLEWTLTPEV